MIISYPIYLRMIPTYFFLWKKILLIFLKLFSTPLTYTSLHFISCTQVLIDTLLFNVYCTTIRGLKGHHHGVWILCRNAFYFLHNIEKHVEQFHENLNSINWSAYIKNLNFHEIVEHIFLYHVENKKHCDTKSRCMMMAFESSNSGTMNIK